MCVGIHHFLKFVILAEKVYAIAEILLVQKRSHRVDIRVVDAGKCLPDSIHRIFRKFFDRNVTKYPVQFQKVGERHGLAFDDLFAKCGSDLLRPHRS